MIYVLNVYFSEVDSSFKGPHLIFTNMGDEVNPAHLCYSQVGRMGKGKGQIVNLGSSGCFVIGRILHETLHALGEPFPFIWKNYKMGQYHFFCTGATHEMMRADRDSFVRVLEENLQPGSEKNFQKKGTDLYSARDTAFDFNSVMMYGPTDFGKLDSNGKRKTTIQPLIPGVEIRSFLAVIAALYLPYSQSVSGD